MRLSAVLSLLLITAPVLAQDGGDDMLAGMSALRRDDHATAEQAFTRAVAASPGDTRTWYYRGVNRLGAGDLDGALRDFDRAIALGPDDVHSLLRRAEVHARLDAGHAATADLQRVLALQPTGPAAEHALLYLGHFAMTGNDPAAARTHYDRLIEIAPYNALGWCDRGIVLGVMREDAAALADLEHAIGLDPALEQAHAQKAMILFRMGRRQEGCDALYRAHDLGDLSVEEMMMIHCE